MAKTKKKLQKLFPAFAMRLDPKVRELLVKKAARYAQGDLSGWLRHAGARYVPKKGEKIKTRSRKAA